MCYRGVRGDRRQGCWHGRGAGRRVRWAVVDGRGHACTRRRRKCERKSCAARKCLCVAMRDRGSRASEWSGRKLRQEAAHPHHPLQLRPAQFAVPRHPPVPRRQPMRGSSKAHRVQPPVLRADQALHLMARRRRHPPRMLAGQHVCQVRRSPCDKARTTSRSEISANVDRTPLRPSDGLFQHMGTWTHRRGVPRPEAQFPARGSPRPSAPSGTRPPAGGPGGRRSRNVRRPVARGPEAIERLV